MCRLIETIKISGGSVENVFWHNKRFNETRLKLFDIKENIELNNFINIPEEYKTGLVKCRIVYSREIEYVEFEPYIFRKISSLKIVSGDHIEYPYKYSDRSKLLELLQKKDLSDDILIIKNGNVSDCSFSNVVLSDGNGSYTPSSPLLEGTKRAKYLSEGIIKLHEITLESLRNYKEIHLINAFLDIGDCIISIENVSW